MNTSAEGLHSTLTNLIFRTRQVPSKAQVSLDGKPWNGTIFVSKDNTTVLLGTNPQQKTITLVWRSSITDLATDIAYHLSLDQGKELLDELDRFIMCEQSKFKGKL